MITAADIILYLSGGRRNRVGPLSIGGERSEFSLSAMVGSLPGVLPGPYRTTGYERWRCLDLRVDATAEADRAFNARAHLSPNANPDIAWGLAKEDVSQHAPLPTLGGAGETLSPRGYPMETFPPDLSRAGDVDFLYRATTYQTAYATGLPLGDVGAGSTAVVRLWVWCFVYPGCLRIDDSLNLVLACDQRKG